MTDTREKESEIETLHDGAAIRYAIVTGCSPSSIGFLAAKALALSPHRYRVILACRDPEKGKQAEDSIRQAVVDEYQKMRTSMSGEVKEGEREAGGISPPVVAAASADIRLSARYRHLDLASMESIRNFATEVGTIDNGAIRDRFGLSLLINNAGIGWGPRTPYLQTKDGLEEIVGVNHFGHFALTIQLLKYIKKAATIVTNNNNNNNDIVPECENDAILIEPRVVVLASSLHDPDFMKSRGKENTKALTDEPDANVINDNDGKKVRNFNDCDGNNQDDENNVSSDTAELQSQNFLLPDFPNGILPKDDGTYDGGKAYRVSKLCNIWFVHELQRRLDAMMKSNNNKGSESLQKKKDSDSVIRAVHRRIKAISVSPGFIPSTGLTRRSGILGSVFLRYVLDPLRHIGIGPTRSPDDGARAILEAATSSSTNIAGGEYFHLPKVAYSSSEPLKNGPQAISSSSVVCSIERIRSSDESYDETKAKRLWVISIKICQLENDIDNLAEF